MRRTAVVISSLLATLLGAGALAQEPRAGEIDAHVAAARAAAGQDYRATFVNLCLPSAPPAGGAGRGAAGRGAVAGGPQTPDRANWYAPPFKVFDNLYWLGTRQHSSWALQTSAGIIIIDTNFAWATEPEIIERPDQARTESPRHQVRDHQPCAWRPRPGRGGVAEALWRQGGDGRAQTGRPPCSVPPTAAGGVPKRDIAVGPEGTKLTLGDTTIQIVATPGHTPGTLSYVFPVKDQGRTVMVAYSGGTLTGAFGTDGARWDEYIASQRKIAQGGGRSGGQRHPFQSQRIRRRLHQGSPARRAASAG